MKHLYIIPFFMLASCNSNNERQSVSSIHTNTTEETENVYICTGKKSHAYHSNINCWGLNKCSGDIEEISKEDAEEMGRTPCHFCH